MNMFRVKIFQLLVLGIVLMSCDSKDDLDATPPVLSVVPIDLSSVTHSIPFGEELSATQKNPAFEYIVDNTNEPVVSCLDGYIDNIIENTSFSDVEIHVKPSLNSEWLIIYDHIKNTTLTKGDFVNAGETLGIVGEGNRVELQINQGDGSSAIAHCPFNYATTNFIADHLTILDNWCVTQTVNP